MSSDLRVRILKNTLSVIFFFRDDLKLQKYSLIVFWKY